MLCLAQQSQKEERSKSNDSIKIVSRGSIPSATSKGASRASKMRAIARKEDTASTLKQEQQVMYLCRSGVFIAVFDHGKWGFKERKVYILSFPGSLTRFTVVKNSIRNASSDSFAYLYCCLTLIVFSVLLCFCFFTLLLAFLRIQGCSRLLQCDAVTRNVP